MQIAVFSLFVFFVVCKHVPDHNVWVSDSQQPFVEQEGMSTDVLYMKEKQPLVFPCRVTHPNVTTTLVKVSATHHIAPKSPPTPTPTPPPPPTPPRAPLGPSPLQITRNNCSYLGSHYTVACVAICLRPSADMCESVCGHVCECRRLSAE